MLILPIKKKWFDMILSGEKKEEYRNIKPYWKTRILTWLGFPKYTEKCVIELLYQAETITPKKILFRNGYSANSPQFIGLCTVRIGTGKKEWGAEKDRYYFVLTIHEIIRGELKCV